ncbi:hypothetical protein OBV_03010 [Oscillibacter valericigenes Sjm18-20]|nr:hypothetical protein OBV_03010 [Oscillibacter valericigenes Sjm18-20]
MSPCAPFSAADDMVLAAEPDGEHGDGRQGSAFLRARPSAVPGRKARINRQS